MCQVCFALVSLTMILKLRLPVPLAWPTARVKAKLNLSSTSASETMRPASVPSGDNRKDIRVL